MTRMHAKAPTLAWLLTALTILLTGMVVTEGRQLSATLPAPPVAVAAIAESTAAATPTPEPTPPPTRTPTPPPILLPGGPGNPR